MRTLQRRTFRIQTMLKEQTILNVFVASLDQKLLTIGCHKHLTVATPPLTSLDQARIGHCSPSSSSARGWVILKCKTRSRFTLYIV